MDPVPHRIFLCITVPELQKFAPTARFARPLLVPEPTLLVCDGTYIFVEKSQNYVHQKKTYNAMKKRNFVKVMNIVACDGTIVYSIAPFPAVQNDAKILEHILKETIMLDNLLPGDILLLDRGFRDVVNLLEGRGIVAKMPAFVQSSDKKGQLNTQQANRSRLVTALRFVVETRNGHLKSIWKMFDTNWCSYAQAHLPDDVEICSALINKYYATFESNTGIAPRAADSMLAKMNDENLLGNVITSDFKTKFKDFTLFENFAALPTMAKDRLFWVSLGNYQIRQAVSYTQMHLNQNNNYFKVWVCPDEICHQYFPWCFVNDQDPALFMMKLSSRFQSNVTRRTFLLMDRRIIDENDTVDERSVLGYYCDCYNGWRTVGCCSHITTLIMFLLVTKGNDLGNPSAFLNDFFNQV